MPTSDIGIDLGTRNSLAYSTGKGLVLNEPSIVVYDKNTEKIRAIGEEARLMEGRITSDMEIIRPIRQGVIVDYTVTEKMLKYFISRYGFPYNPIFPAEEEDRLRSVRNSEIQPTNQRFVLSANKHRCRRRSYGFLSVLYKIRE